MRSVVVLGGGISGLATAFYLSKVPKNAIDKIILLESTGRLGGWIQSVRNKDGSVFERGPRSIRGVGQSGFNTLELAEELGLSSRVLPITRTHPAARNRFVYVNKQLHAMPNTLRGVLSNRPPFGRPLAVYALQEMFQTRSKDQDESVDSFFRRRFGADIANFAADPLCRGVFAGDSRTLGIKSCFPPIHRLEQEYGSVVWGGFRKPRDKITASGVLVDRLRSEKWSIWSLESGLEELPAALGKYLEKQPKVKVHLHASCDSVEFEGDKVKICYTEEGKSQVLNADYVVSALPSFVTSRVVKHGKHAQLAALLQKIEFASVAVSSLQYKTNVLRTQGFGHLIPSNESRSILGVIYESNVFPQHNGRENISRLTVMMGGAWFEEAFGDVDQCDVDKISRLAVEAVKNQLDIHESPVRVGTSVLKECIPQYRVGHMDTVDSISEYIERAHLPLTLVGSSLRGVSVNDCIYNARRAVEKLNF